MSTISTSVMATDDGELVSKFQGIRFTNPQEEWSEPSSSSSSGAFNCCIPRLRNPSETLQKRDFHPQIQQYLVLSQQSSEPPLLPFPGSSNSQSYYRLRPDSLPYNDRISNPESSNTLTYKPAFSQRLYHIITRPKESNQLINKVQRLKQTRTPQSSLEIECIILTLASEPISLRLSACDRNGSYALKQLIKTVEKPCPRTSELTQALASEFSNIAFDVFGGHVIRECFEKLSIDDNKVLCSEMAKHCVRLATDEKGCILLNFCIPFMCRAGKEPILEQIASNCQLLAHNCFGTYVVQEAITKQHWKYTLMIVEKLRGFILSLSTQKAGSHLVEKCLQHSSTKQIVMEELLKLSSLQLRELACHEFANFVIQQAISPTQGQESSSVKNLTRMFRKNLHPILNDLHSNQIGRKVCKKYKETRWVIINQRLRAIHHPSG